MARIVNDQIAFNNCTCYVIDPDKGKSEDNLICFSRGVIGALDNIQDKKCLDLKACSGKRTKNCCTFINIEDHSKDWARQLKKFEELGPIMERCLAKGEGKTTKSFYMCIAREATKYVTGGKNR